MPCSICRQTGHNRSTCPRSIGSAHSISGIISTSELATPPPGPRPLPAPPQVDFIHNGPPPLQRTIVDLTDVQGSSNSMRRARKKWRKAFRSIKNIQRFLTVIHVSGTICSPVRMFYPSWLRAKKTLARLTPLMRSELFPS